MPVDYSKFDNIVDSDEDKPKEEKVSKKAAPPGPQPTKCANCGGTPPNLKKCTICKKVAYCSQRCQRDDWRFHKRVCAAPKKEKKDDAPKRPPSEKKKKPAKKAESDDDDDDDDGPITWYKHRETKLPDSNVVHTKLAPPSPEALQRTESSASAGSAWNTAGTWEERDVLPAVKKRVGELLKQMAPRDFGSGVIAAKRVEKVEGDASVGVIRGRKRHFVDIVVEVAFEVRLGGDGKAYAGKVRVKDYTAEAASEAVDVDVEFTDHLKLPAHAVTSVRSALGKSCSVEPGDTSTFAGDVVAALNAGLLPVLGEL